MSNGRLISGKRPALVIYPVVIAVAWVVNQGLVTEATPASMLRPVLVAAGIAVLLVVIFALAFRNRWDGALVAGVVVLLVILPFPLYKLALSLGPQVGFVCMAVTITALIAIPALLLIRARRRKEAFPRPSAGVLNGLSLLLLLVVLVSNTFADAGTFVARLTAGPAAAQSPGPQAETPDMVVILLDGYPRTDVLQRRLGIDNSAFLDGLQARGFDVASDSYSNYVFTAATLASMFQMEYLDPGEIQPEIGSPGGGHDLLRHDAVSGASFATLKQAGYEIVTSPPGWDHVTLADVSDRVINDGHITELERSLLEQTWLLDLVTLVAPDAITGSMRARLTGAFDSLDAFAGEDRSTPAFVFMHVPAPHPPLLLDQAGNLLQVGPRDLSGNSPAGMGVTRDEYLERWQGEVSYLDQRVTETVDALQAADPDTVIVVMSDHGYGQEFQASDPETRFANLFAAYTPGAKGLLADAPTPVNLMPRILDHYLGTSYPERPDRFFLSPDDVDPLVMVELQSPTGRP